MRRAIVPPELQAAAEASGFSPAIRAGDFLFLTGATGGAPDGTMPADAVAQSRNALGKVLTILQVGGATADDVVEITSYFSDIDADFSSVERVMQEIFGSPLPAWTALEAGKLRRPGARIEFRVVAYCPQSNSSVP